MASGVGSELHKLGSEVGSGWKLEWRGEWRGKCNGQRKGVEWRMEVECAERSAECEGVESAVES